MSGSEYVGGAADPQEPTGGAADPPQDPEDDTDPLQDPNDDTYETIEMDGLVDMCYVLDKTDPKNPKRILLRLGGTMIH